jgi:hypothetical protein
MTDRHALIMYDTTTGDHQLYDVYIGEDADLGAVSLAMHESTPTRRPILLDVNALIVESGVTPGELVEILENAP